MQQISSNTVRGLPYITSELRLKFCMLIIGFRLAQALCIHTETNATTYFVNLHFGVVSECFSPKIACKNQLRNMHWFSVTAYPHASPKAWCLIPFGVLAQWFTSFCVNIIKINEKIKVSNKQLQLHFTYMNIL